MRNSYAGYLIMHWVKDNPDVLREIVATSRSPRSPTGDSVIGMRRLAIATLLFLPLPATAQTFVPWLTCLAETRASGDTLRIDRATDVRPYQVTVRYFGRQATMPLMGDANETRYIFNLPDSSNFIVDRNTGRGALYAMHAYSETVPGGLTGYFCRPGAQLF